MVSRIRVEVFKRTGGWAHPKITIRLELEPDMKGLLPVEQYSLVTHAANLSARTVNSPQFSLGPDTVVPVSESKQTFHPSTFSLRREASESRATKSSRQRSRGATPSKHLDEASTADRLSFSNSHPQAHPIHHPLLRMFTRFRLMKGDDEERLVLAQRRFGSAFTSIDYRSKYLSDQRLFKRTRMIT